MKQIKKIHGEEVFQVPEAVFAIGISTVPFTLNYSVTGDEGSFVPYAEETPAGDILTVTAPKGLFYKLVGNSVELSITY